MFRGAKNDVLFSAGPCGQQRRIKKAAGGLKAGAGRITLSLLFNSYKQSLYDFFKVK